MDNQIDAAVAEAERAAAEMGDAQVPATQSQSGQLAAGGGAVDMSLTGFLKSGGLSPDKWVQVDEYGIKLDKNEKQFVEEFTGELDFANVKFFQGLRTKLPGNKYSYIKTYDGKTEARSGQNWNAAVSEANARAIEPASPYRGADVLITLTEALKQGKSDFAVGTKVGYTTAITAFGAFQNYLNEQINAGNVTVGANDSLSGVVVTKATHEEKKNSDYKWGILNFQQV